MRKRVERSTRTPSQYYRHYEPILSACAVLVPVLTFTSKCTTCERYESFGLRSVEVVMRGGSAGDNGGDGNGAISLSLPHPLLSLCKTGAGIVDGLRRKRSEGTNNIPDPSYIYLFIYLFLIHSVPYLFSPV